MARKNQLTPKSFEAALAELEQILADIEAGEVPLEESLVKYERGQFLIQHCRAVLGQAEKQIEQLGKGEGDELRATPLTAAGGAEEAVDDDDADEARAT
jgi:exodeoxyribonuclease VII small subunit